MTDTAELPEYAVGDEEAETLLRHAYAKARAGDRIAALCCQQDQFITHLQRTIDGMAERIAKQSELLSKRAEKA